MWLFNVRNVSGLHNSFPLTHQLAPTSAKPSPTPTRSPSLSLVLGLLLCRGTRKFRRQRMFTTPHRLLSSNFTPAGVRPRLNKQWVGFVRLIRECQQPSRETRPSFSVVRTTQF
jgi:hypothetical protein